MSQKNTQATKASAAKRTLNGPAKKETTGSPFNDQDPKRRLGNFSGAGEHPREGGRSAGIVGQTKQKGHTDKKSD